MAHVRVEGLREVRKALREAGDDMSELKDSHAEVANIVARAAAVEAPRRTGRLAGSIRGNRAQRKAVVKSNLIYAPVIHWGWPGHGIEPNQFLLRGIKSSEPRWLSKYEQDLERIAQKAERVTAQ